MKKLQNALDDFEDTFLEFKKECGIGLTIVLCVLMLGIIFLFECLDVAICMGLWNFIVANVFGAATLSFWQMFGLKILIFMLWPSKIAAVSKEAK